MKIAMLAPPYLSVPPEKYGGTERIVSFLTEGLVKRGHDVTLFASGDSKTSAKLHSLYPNALGNSGLNKNEPLYPLMHLTECFRRQEEFDVIHNHAQFLSLFLAEYATTPVVHTWHGSFYESEGPEARRLVMKMFKNQNYISISHNQRQALPELNYVGTVYNSIDIKNVFTFKENSLKNYVLWTGRIVAKKGPKDSILASRKAGIRIEMAAAIDPIEMDYFKSEIEPLIDNRNVIFHGELSEAEMRELYQNALCTLYPISWHEPFGLVMVESMACGTPVVAYNAGSVPEIVKDGETGFIINNDQDIQTSSVIQKTGIDGLVAGIQAAGSISRNACRSHVEQHFTIERMVEGYERIYRTLING